MAPHKHIPPERLPLAQAAILMHRLDAHIPSLADAVFRQINGIPPKPERASVGTPGPGEQADERGLARAVIAKQSHDLSFRHVQIGVPQRRHRAERFSYPSYTEQHSH